MTNNSHHRQGVHRRHAVAGSFGRLDNPRHPSDLYETPAAAIDMLLQHLPVCGPVLEPSAGRGAIVRELRRHGLMVHASDHHDHKADPALHIISGVDFLTTTTLSGCCTVIMNPPFKGSDQHVRHALRLLPDDGTLAALLRNQIELRAAAEFVSDWCGQPSILRQAFADGLDAHTATAQRMTGKVRPEDVTPEERQAAKPCNFGLLYRMGARGFFNYLRTSFEPGITYEEASRRRDLFFAGYPDLARWQDEHSRHSRECGFTSTVAGRLWRWEWNAKNEEDVDPDAPFYEDQLTGFNGALAVNLPIQGSCAEVMMLALTRLHATLRDQPATLIATVHDEAVLLVPDDMQVATAIADVACREMVAAFLDVFPNAPTVNLVEPKIGRNWGETQALTKWLGD